MTPITKIHPEDRDLTLTTIAKVIREGVHRFPVLV
jgi:hypothetical protein